MGLFRRKGRDREAAAESPGSSVPEPSPASTAGPGPATSAPPDEVAPPPLPRGGPAGRSASPAERFARCFVCGTPLDADGACPQCRIAWLE